MKGLEEIDYTADRAFRVTGRDSLPFLLGDRQSQPADGTTRD